MFTCVSCGKQFEKRQSLGWHTALHNRGGKTLQVRKTFEELKTPGSRRIRLIQERGHRCEVCKNVEWMGRPIPLELDHINGLHDDQRKENARLICPNCHAQTETYKAKNKGRNSGTKRQDFYKKYPIAQYRT